MYFHLDHRELVKNVSINILHGTRSAMAKHSLSNYTIISIADVQ